MSLVKQFIAWISLKEKLHNNKYKPPLFKEGEIWWCSIGENVGSEINGKSNLFSRPILVYKKLSVNTFLGIPTSSQDRKGTWYFSVTIGKNKSVVILSQVRVLDYKRLSSRVVELNVLEMNSVKEGFKKLYCP